MKMVILTQMEARFLLELIEEEVPLQRDINDAVEILEEALLQPQEYDIPDGRVDTVPLSGDTDTQVVQCGTGCEERGELSLGTTLGEEQCAGAVSEDD